MEKIIRRALENAVAVYSLPAVRPGKPQSQVGPTVTRRLRPQASQRSAGTTESRTSMAAIPAVETVPARAVPAEITKPLAATNAGLIRTPMARWVMGSKTGRNQVAPSPSATQPAARKAMANCIEGATSRARAAASLRGRARKVIPKAFTKQAAARAAVSASNDPATGNITRVRLWVVPNPASNAW